MHFAAHKMLLRYVSSPIDTREMASISSLMRLSKLSHVCWEGYGILGHSDPQFIWTLEKAFYLQMGLNPSVTFSS